MGERINLTGRGLRGLSFGETARQVGALAGLPVADDATDEEVLGLLTQGLAEIVAAAGFNVVDPVRVATIANIALTGEQTIDGVDLVAGDRVLAKKQTSAAANGIYVVAAGAWARAADFDQTAEVLKGTYVMVDDGVTQSGGWVLTTANPITVGTTAQEWRPFRLDDYRRIRSELRGTGGSDMIGFTMPITNAIQRSVYDKQAERASWFDFMNYGARFSCMEGSDNADRTDDLETIMDQLPPGAALNIPGRVNFEGPIVREESIGLFGIGARENQDNSQDFAGIGSQLIFRGNDGDALTFLRPDGISNHTIHVLLRDFSIVGNRLRHYDATPGPNGPGTINPDAISGRALVFHGAEDNAGHTSNIVAKCLNVHVSQAMDVGLDVFGACFGSIFWDMFLHRCGYAGLAVRSTGVGAGEIDMARMRIFQNGWRGTDAFSRAGAILLPASTLNITQMSCSESKGPGLIGAGMINIGTLQMESNGQDMAVTDSGTDAAPSSRKTQLIIGCKPELGAGAPDQGCTRFAVANLSIDPGDLYRGYDIRILANTRNIRLAGNLYNTRASNHGTAHIRREQGSEGLDIRELAGATTNIDLSDDFSTRVICDVFARQTATDGNVTGHGTAIDFKPAEVYDAAANYDPATGEITARMNMLLKGEYTIPVSTIKSTHDRSRTFVVSNANNRTINHGSPAQSADTTSSGVINLDGTFSIPLRAGQKVKVRYEVGAVGQPQTVGVQAGGFLSAWCS